LIEVSAGAVLLLGECEGHRILIFIVDLIEDFIDDVLRDALLAKFRANDALAELLLTLA